ncbi:GNAT family N-acetyltransferase [Clostridiaceae bacterium M8S5]|nr:GNAT family N-acetyltransferase [Clostridiaceae bacterium M8S5]
MKISNDIIKTKRLILRLPTTDDYKEHFKFQCSLDNFEFVDMKELLHEKEAKDYFKRMESGVNNNKWLFWVIADKCTNEPFGTISVWNINHKKGEYAYTLYPKARGKGYMIEALRAINNFCFNTLGFETLYAWTHEKNEASIKLLKRAEFLYVKTVVEKGHAVKIDFPYAVFKLDNPKFNIFFSK